MIRGVFWKLFIIQVAGTLALFAIIQWLVMLAEEQMSFLAPNDRRELESMAAHAEALYLSKQHDALNTWVLELQARENTWVAVIDSRITLVAGDHLDPLYMEYFALGRSVDWMIHLYQSYNPVMELPFADERTHFLIRLPERMRPGELWQPTRLLLQTALPFLVMAIVCLLLYRHLISPVRTLEKATQQFANGHFEARVSNVLGQRNDELGALARTFDSMAERTGGLILTQRRLLADFSHELRTPLTRVELALDQVERGASPEAMERMRREVSLMRTLAEDALTLSWLDTEQPDISKCKMDLVDLIECIVDDARFEFSDRYICTCLPDTAELIDSCPRLLGQALENIVRNALRFTAAGGTVELQLEQHEGVYILEVSDQGPGVPEQDLENIFTPFFKVKHKNRDDQDGFGLGLALVKRQIGLVRGTVLAHNLAQGGLKVVIQLPRG